MTSAAIVVADCSMPYYSSEWTIDNLVELEKSLWTEYDPDRFGFAKRRESRDITVKELVGFLHVCKSNPVVLIDLGGFGVGLSLIRQPRSPGVAFENVCTITKSHLGDGVRFDESWDLFSPIALREENILWLKTLGIKMSTNKSSYTY